MKFSAKYDKIWYSSCQYYMENLILQQPFLNCMYIKYKAGWQMDRQNVIIKFRKER
ncbi:MAG: hypothetical protein HFJ03_06525 [Lachnospira sp.]|jgi:hypothetical protein|nr:hypothetical protein [Lachnospira sp.]